MSLPLHPQLLVKEQFIQSKTGNPDDCEDALFSNEYFVAVIDGATSKTSRRWHGITGGRVAANIISQAFVSMSPDYTARQATDLMTAMVHEYYLNCNALEVVKNNPHQRITASLAAISAHRQEVWLIGDCHILLGNFYISNHKKIDKILSEVRALVLELSLEKGIPFEQLRQRDTGREFIMPLLKEQMLFQNNPSVPDYFFPAIDGFNVPDTGIQIIPIPGNVDTIVLATDGYPVLFDNFEETEQMLQDILARDPLLFRTYLSTKGMKENYVSFDDRALIKVHSKRSSN